MQVSEVFVPFPRRVAARDDHRGKRRVHHHEWDQRNHCWRDWDEWR
jgi:hypothetical protein